MCFALQRCALCQHPDFKKWSEPVSFLTFWLWNVLRARAACNFSTSQLQKVAREWCVLNIFTLKCASRHSRVQFFMSPLNTWLRTRRFSEPTFRPRRRTNHWKNKASPDFPNISRVCIFFILPFAQLYLLSFDSTFKSLLFIFWLYFSALRSTFHIVGGFTSKLPLARSQWALSLETHHQTSGWAQHVSSHKLAP